MMKLYIPLFALCCGFQLQAQTVKEPWTLEQCINHALEHNINLKQKAQEEERQKVELHTNKHSWLPDLNASMGQNFDFGRSPSKTGVIVDQNSANSSAGVQISMPIFNGLKIPNSIAASKLDLQAATASLDKAKEDLAINITSYYIQVLYNKELLKIAKLQYGLSNQQIKQTEALVNVGKVPLAQLYDIKAQLAKNEVSVAEAQNSLNLSLLDLAQSLELESENETMDIVMPASGDAIEKYMGSIIPPEQIFANAVTFKPQIKEQQFLLESQKKRLKIAKADFYPKLNLGASYSNGYYRYSGNEDTNSNISFGDQLKNNARKTIGFSLSIPIFNRFRVSNNVKHARINIHSQQLRVDDSKKILYKEIQQAYYNATAAQKKYNAAEKSVLASKEAFSYAEERYSAGKSSAFDFAQAQTQYMQSLSEQMQAKYDYIFRTKILDFYNGVPISL